MILSPNEIAWLCLKFWPDKADAKIAIAICLAESAGDTNAMHRSITGTNIGNRDHGLFQLSNKWNGARLQAIVWWRIPLYNVQLAKELYDEWKAAGKDPWEPWHVYTSKSYETYLPDAEIALAHPFPPPQEGLL